MQYDSILLSEQAGGGRATARNSRPFMRLLQEGLFGCSEEAPGGDSAHSGQPPPGEVIGPLARCVPLGYTGWQGEVS